MQGDLWDAPRAGATLIGVTTNAYVSKAGMLVMGRGAALEAANRYPALQRRAGDAIRRGSLFYGPMERYGWAVVSTARFDDPTPWEAPQIGLFQVKHHYGQPADLELIRYSCDRLSDWLEPRRGEIVAINFPGIGNGRLSRTAVLPIIQRLPDRVLVYEKEG